MNTQNKFLALAVSAVLLSSCSKDQDNAILTDSAETSSLTELVIPQDFNWSSSFKGNVEIIIDAPDYLKTEGQTVELIDGAGNVLERRIVSNGTTSFYVSRPQNEGSLFAKYPNTGEQIEITSGSQVLELQEVSFDGLASNLIQSGKKSTTTNKGKTQSANMVTGGDFDNGGFPVDPAAFTVLRSLGGWYARDNFNTITNIGGNNVFTSNNANSNADILQAFAVNGDDMFDFSYDFGGNGGFFVLFFDANQNFIGYSTVYTSGNTGSTNFITPASVAFIQIYGFCSSSSWLDNVNLTETVEADDDNDGVPNRQDDYPNDANRAYKSGFPTIGKQILAFEDLWPSAGDYDFNDLVISNTVEYSRDANGVLVDAEVSVTVLGLGAGLSSGLAIHLLQEDGQTFNNNIIASVSGGAATLDNDVDNGIIVFTDDRKALKPFYNNNGFGPDGEPQEFTFTITFNSNAGTQYVLPDFYIYRSSERGREIHLSGFTGTSAADASLFNTKNDVNGTYRTDNGLPWVVEVVSPNAEYFNHPIEKVDMGTAYPKFKTWAQSGGVRYAGWMLLGDKTKLYINE